MSGYGLRAARLATPTEILEDAFMTVEGGQVGQVGRGSPPPGPFPVIDLGDALVAPGFIGVHVHGGGGCQVNCASQEEVGARR
jgi:N-acetylglucosamine-6-phosphate deacetylase